MKKILLVFGCCALFAACNNSENKSEGEAYYDNSTSDAEISAATRQSEVDTSINDIGTDRTASVPAATAATDTEKGKNLIAMSDCLSCHQVDKKLVGPGYEEVAAKYEYNDKNVDYLAGKIIKGGSGVWGQIPMTPHPNVSEEDAKEMAKYVLSLRK
ncbi:c-type cytochrome [Pontibacter sp. E15-1]|uniref:c-type cytochrome n=1 Tax=Pontibacter sp. E15-1 TaxID=2919918 RepID=UPI001F5005E1|nr:c-type cytochrome [Pontibacter sp. E15-1]MCJ8167065.1 c-type cytochrome [Pontibacter sp. E15-1]